MGAWPDIRAAGLDDAQEIARLSGEFGYPATAYEIEARLAVLSRLESHFVAVVPASSGALLGWVAAEHRSLLESGDMAEIVGLVVDRTVKRSGIGTALVADAERWARSRGLNKIVVRSNTIREESHAFYRSLGFSRKKTQYAYVKNL